MLEKNRITLVLLALLAMTIMAATMWKVAQNSSEPPADLIGVLRTDFRPLKPFQLHDQNRLAFDEQRFTGKWSFVFFGYTSCPDICPMTLSVINSVKRLLDNKGGAQAEAMQVVFVSVDPGRDTAEKLAEYMKFFNPGFIGLTGDKTEIDKLASQSGAGYVMEPETSPGEYLVAHTSAIFLIDPAARVVASFSQPHVPETIVSQYDAIRAYMSEK